MKKENQLFCQVEVVEGMEEEDEVVGVKEVMGEVATEEVVAADGREGELIVAED